MRYSNQQKTMALVVGVLAMVFSISLIVWAWTEPGSIPPGGNVLAPINVGSTPQTKTGNLTLLNLYLNAIGDEGDVYNADEIIGYGDLILRGKLGNAAPIYLEGISVIINNDPGTGNVGIGTANPGARLDIRSSAENVMTLIGSGGADTTMTLGGPSANIGEKYITYQNAETGSNAWLVGMGDDEKFHFDYSPLGELNESTSRLTIQQNGNVGIGTTEPIAKLAVGGIGSVGDAIAAYSNGECSAIYAEQLGSIGYAGYFSGLVYMSGNVGIGTTSPSQKLDVDGNIRVRSIINCYQLGTDSSGNLICIPPACLEEGSLALTPDGFKKIEELKVGDEVIGYKNGEKVAAKITKTSVHDGSWTMYYYKGYWFTGNHKVYTDYEHFEEMSKLSDVTKEYIGKVYDISVEETQNYFGENGLLIHNK